MNQDHLPFVENAPLKPAVELAKPIQIVDLFAGPGGLGEGFSASGKGEHFEIVISAEKDSKAWQTLRLRAFYRLLKKKNEQALLREYYDFCNDPKKTGEFSPSPSTKALWDKAAEEAQCITLGSEEGNRTLDEALDERLDMTRPWVLIGGPPCQAYSIVGRARNQAKANYKAEDDHRHFLYKEYLRIIRERQPTIFVMENVKGILSSKVNNERIFSNILRDLSDPREALHEGGAGTTYRIFSLVTGASFGPGENVDKIDPRAFIIKAEDYGIPQARHRVILLGIATHSLPASIDKVMLKTGDPKVTVGQVLKNLPKLRSGLTKLKDSPENWIASVMEQLDFLCSQIDPLDTKIWKAFHEQWRALESPPESSGSRRFKRATKKNDGTTGNKDLDHWYLDENLEYWLNHEVRGHMPSDLRRYLYAAVYAKCHGFSPKGHKGFNLEGLAPDHKNWETGKFSDRFRVQMEDHPATTITSHISKDGHYFIHYDPSQCRSLSVREAARIQTFPDSYFFQGNRTEQFHQVGNAVPPLLASKIAKVVYDILFDNVYAFDKRGAVIAEAEPECPRSFGMPSPAH